MIKQTTIAFLLALGLILSTHLLAQPTKALSSPYLDSCFQTFMETNHVPGASACIIKEGQIRWIGAYGDANIELGIPMDTTTLIYIASIAKTVTVTALMQLWEEGLFNLEDSINAYLPFEVRNPNYPSVPITFRMLCTHTSSIRDNWVIMPEYWGIDPPFSLAEYLFDYLNPDGANYNQELNYYNNESPGTNYHYSNTGVSLMGYLVEILSDTSFAAQTKERIFEPLQMNESSWFLSQVDTMHLAMPYSWTGNNYIPYGHYSSCGYPAGGLRTSVDQLANFLLCYMNGGTNLEQQILQGETVDTILSSQIPQIDPDIGLIWYVASVEGKIYCGHGGGNWGVKTSMYFRPEDDIGVIILTNGESSLTDIAFLAFDYATDSIITHCLPDGITFSTQEEIDNFHTNYPYCSEIEGNVIIEGEDITNLDGLYGLNSVSGFL